MYGRVEKQQSELYREDAPRDPRDIELGLRAIAHLGQPHPYRALARLLADDVYEIFTGKDLDAKHQNRERVELERAFKESRHDQERMLGDVNAVMSRYGVERDVAYKMLTGELPMPVEKKVKFVKAGELTEAEVREAELAAALARERIAAEAAAREAEEARTQAEAKAAAAEAASHAERAEEKKAELKEERKRNGKKGSKANVKKKEEEDFEAALREMEDHNAKVRVDLAKKEAADAKKLAILTKQKHIGNLKVRIREEKDYLAQREGEHKKGVELFAFRNGRKIALSEADILQSLQNTRDLIAELERNVTDLEEEVEELRGSGRQHKDFAYSRPDMTAAEKARERASHYRKVAREAAGAYEVPGNGNTRSLARFDAEGKMIPFASKTNPSKHQEYMKGSIKKVVLSEEEKAREAARGLKPKSEKHPKKDSERKPYVGSKMKEQLFMASPFDDHESKEFKALLRRASKMYKEGEGSWEEVMRRVLAP